MYLEGIARGSIEAILERTAGESDGDGDVRLASTGSAFEDD